MSTDQFVDEDGVTHKLSPLRFENPGIKLDDLPPQSSDILTAHKTGIARIDERIDRLEAMVKRIAAHLGIE